MIHAIFPTLGFLMGGGSTSSILFAAYALHAALVLACGVFGGDVLAYACLSATDLLFIERSHAATGSVWSWVSGVVGIWLEPARSQLWVVLRAATLTLAGNPPPTEIGAWILCLILSLMPPHILADTTPVRRLILGWLSFAEASRARVQPDDPVHHTIRYTCFLSFLALFLVRHATNNPKRLQSALTILTTSALSWCGLRSAWLQWQSPNALIPSHTRVAAFYISYCIVDTCFAHAHYPQYFTLLEGWVHHVGTGGLAVYFLWQGKASLFCPAMMVETSTILLSTRRTFYDSPFVKWVYDEWFPTLFILFRVVLPVCFLIRIRAIVSDTPVVLPAFGLFSAVNLYWLTRIRQKKNTKR